MVLLNQLAQDVGQPQRLERGDRHRHEAEGGAHRPTLAAEIDAVARRAGDTEGDVELQLAVELVAPHGLQHGLRQVLEVGGGAGALVHGEERAVHPVGRRCSDLHVKVRSPHGDHGLQVPEKIPFLFRHRLPASLGLDSTRNRATRVGAAHVRTRLDYRLGRPET